MRLLLLFIAMLAQPQQPARSAEADVWMATLYQLRMNQDPGQRGPLVLVDRTMPSSTLHPAGPGDPALFSRLVAINDTVVQITGFLALPNTRIIPWSTLPKPKANEDLFAAMNWKKFARDFPGGRLLRLTRPAFSEDGSRALIYYELRGRFDDGQGGYLIFEQRAGLNWVIAGNLGNWIS